MGHSKIYTDLTGDLRDKIQSELDRTALSEVAFIKLLTRENLGGPSLKVLQNWTRGRVTRVRPGQLSTVLDTLKSLPNGYGNTREADTKLGQKGRKIPAHKIPVEDFQPELLQEMKRTNLQPAAIMRLLGKGVPTGLSAQKISLWSTKRLKFADKTQIECVLNLLRSIP